MEEVTPGFAVPEERMNPDLLVPPDNSESDISQYMTIPDETLPTKRASTQATDSTLAAKGAVMGGGDILTQYKQIMWEFKNTDGFSNTLASIENRKKDNAVLAARAAAGDILINGGVNIQEGAVEALRDGLQAVNGEVQKQDVDSSYAMDSYTNSNNLTPEEEEEDIGAGSIYEMVSAKQRVQARVNSWAASNLTGDTSDFWTGVAQSSLPFIEATQVDLLKQTFEETTGEKLDSSTWFGVDAGRVFQSVMSTGTGKRVMKEALDKMYEVDPQKAEQTATQLLGSIGSSTDILYKNDFGAFMRLQELLSGGSGNYNEERFLGLLSDETVDNVTGLLDIVGVGALIKGVKNPTKFIKHMSKLEPDSLSRALKIPLKEPKVQKVVENAIEASEQADTLKRVTVDSTSPTAPGNLSSTLNPDRTRQLYDVAILGDEEAKLAAWGTKNEGDIVTHAYGYQAARADGTVEARATPTSLDIVDEMVRIGNVRRFSESELKALQDKIIKGYTNLAGKVKLKPNMSSFRTEGENVYVDAIYAGDKAFKSVESARRNAAFLLRESGVRPEDIQIIGEFKGQVRALNDDELLKLTKPKKAPLHRGVIEGGSKRAEALKGPSKDAGRDIIEPGSLRAKALEGPKKALAEKQVEVPDRYYVRVRMAHKVTDSDFDALTQPTIKNNIFDRVFAKFDGWMPSDSRWGSLQQHLVDAASTFKDRFMSGANVVADDKGSYLEKLLFDSSMKWQKKFESLNSTEKAKFNEFVVVANRDGIRFDPIKAKGDGWSSQMVDAMYDWRALWDKIHQLENLDMVKSLKQRGFKIFTDKTTDTNLIVKPVHKSQISQYLDVNGIRVYDVNTGKMKQLSANEVSDLYKNGGTVARLRSPEKVGGEALEFVVSKEKANTGYIRDLRDNEAVLPYREGYYNRRYQDKYFVEKHVYDQSGNLLYKRATGSAKSQVEAEALTARMTETDPHGAEYSFRRSRDYNDLQDSLFELNQAGGRSAQRLRGEHLETWRTDSDLGYADIENPMEAIVHSIKSIASRTSTRDVLNTQKNRLLQNYKDYLPKDDYGNALVPSSTSEIYYRGAGLENKKMLGDAKTLHNFIRSQEEGYVNLIDEVYKHGMNLLAESLGESKTARKLGIASGAEKALTAVAQGKGPAAAAKSTLAVMVLFSNVLRQFAVQSLQALQLLGIGRPGYVFTGKLQGQMLALMLEYSGLGSKIPDKALSVVGWTRADLKFATESLARSGQIAGIDKHNLVRGSLLDMADRAAASKLRRAVTSPLHIARRVGMDFGEFCNTTATYLTFLDEAKTSGKNLLDPMVMEDVALKSRNFTGNMNKAGDMPYNHNILSIPLQFAQIGHKMLMNMTFNQHLTKSQKIRLVTTNLLLFGLPAQQLLEEGLGKYLPEDPKSRNKILEGLYGYMLNESIGETFDSSTRIDFGGSLSQTDAAASVVTLGVSLMSGGFAEKAAHSPVGSLLLGTNPKLHQFATELSNWLVPDPNLHPSDLVTVAKSGANLFSGFSSLYKAYYILNFERTLSSRGVTQDYKADAVDAVRALFGFSSMEEVQARASRTMRYDNSSEMKEDMKKFSKLLGGQLAVRGEDVNSLTARKRAMASGFEMFGYSQASWDEWERIMYADAKTGAWSPIVDIYDEISRGNLDDAIEEARMLPDSEPKKQELVKLLTSLKQRNETGEK